jgi:hypothetical protein
MVHQIMDPQNMPATRITVCRSDDWRPTPSVARTAKKERTVVGFVAFSRNAETKSELAEESGSPA